MADQEQPKTDPAAPEKKPWVEPEAEFQAVAEATKGFSSGGTIDGFNSCTS